MPDAKKLGKLSELRRACGKNQKSAATYFGLSENARNEISKWENGEKIPPPKYRDLFIGYLCNFLDLSRDQERFGAIWDILELFLNK